ncbi:MAG: hypothetical protein HYT87_15695 [Nitrospirae bacterium]|nr:hypothetical protein [Nitrospirota bacterium]
MDTTTEVSPFPSPGGCAEPFSVGPIQAEKLTGMSRHYWRQLAYKGVIRSFKVGRRLLLDWGEVKAHIEKHQVERKAATSIEERHS